MPDRVCKGCALYSNAGSKYHGFLVGEGGGRGLQIQYFEIVNLQIREFKVNSPLRMLHIQVIAPTGQSYFH